MAAALYEDKAAFAARTIVVSTTDELTAAIRSLSKGDGGTVLVDGTAGPYQIKAQNLGRDGAPVLIKPLDEAVSPLVEQINLLEASHLTITGMTVDSRNIAEPYPVWEADVNVRLTNDITIVGNDLVNQANGYRDGVNTDVKVGARGAILRDSENINFSHNTVADYRDGIIYLQVKGLTLVGNEITGIQGDGMRGGGIQDVLIAENYMHDFYGSVQTLNHSDMIQIWGTSIEGITKNVVIRDNILDAGNGAATQSILILNEEFNRTGYYDNIKIHDNVIHNALQQGIGVDHVKNLEVTNNTVLWNGNATTQSRVGSDHVSKYPRLIIRDSPDAVVTGNITGTSVVNEEPLTGDDNYVLSFSTPLSDNYAGNHLVNLSHQGDLDLTDLSYLPDSALRGEYGARLTNDPTHETGNIADGETPENHAIINMKSLEGARDGVQLSAELSTLAGHDISDSNVTVLWTFSDGTQREGLSVEHVFETPGVYDVTLDILVDGASIASSTRKTEAKTEEVVDLDFNNGARDRSVFDSEIEIRDGNNDAFVDGRNGDTAFHLNGTHKVLVDRFNRQMTQLETFEFEISLKKDTATSEGILAMFYKVFELRVEEDGELTFILRTSDGYFALTTDEPVLNDTNWHDIRVSYDGPMGTLAIYVDDENVAEREASGMTTAKAGYDLALGSLFSESVHGLVDTLTLTTPTSAKYDDLTADLYTPPAQQDADPVTVIEAIETPVVVEEEEEEEAPDATPDPAPVPEQPTEPEPAPVPEQPTEPEPALVVEQPTEPEPAPEPAPTPVTKPAPTPGWVEEEIETVEPAQQTASQKQEKLVEEENENITSLLDLLARFAQMLENAAVSPSTANDTPSEVLSSLFTVQEDGSLLNEKSDTDQDDTAMEVSAINVEEMIAEDVFAF